MIDLNFFFQIGEWIGTAAFAVSGAMIAIDSGTDIFGVMVLAVVTALGGGTMRDVFIGHFPPRMFSSSNYVALSCMCALTVFVLARIYKERYLAREKLVEQVNNVFDAIGLGVFAVSGFGGNTFLVTFLGMITAVGGGMLRDILIKEIPFVLKKRVYAVAAIAGALCYALMVEHGISTVWAYGAGWSMTAVLRLLATVFRWDLPRAL